MISILGAIVTGFILTLVMVAIVSAIVMAIFLFDKRWGLLGIFAGLFMLVWLVFSIVIASS